MDWRLAERDRAMKLQRTYRFRLEPTSTQEREFRQFAGCRRWVWNWALARKRSVYQATGASLPAITLMAELVLLKQQPETAFLKACDSQALQQTLSDLDRAFVNFLEGRARFPKPKTRKKTPHAFRIPQRVTVEGSHVRVPKIGLVAGRLHRPREGTIKSASIKHAADGHWHVTFVSHFEKEEAPPTALKLSGIDVGLKPFAAFDNGDKVQPPKFHRQQERTLKRLHRRLSRCRKGSRNRSKARRRLTVGNAKVRDRRQDWPHKLSTRIVPSHE